MNQSPETSGNTIPRSTHISLLVVLLVVEALVFYANVARSVAPYYPQQSDQLSYYLSAYDLIESYRAIGWRAFIDELFQRHTAAGTTFILQGALLSLIGGANRTAILSINLIYFVALQVVLFFVIRSRVGRFDFAWIAMALLLMTSTVFQTAGGIYDYRMDFTAFCLFGIWCCLVVWSGAFRHAGRAVFVALAAILLIYTRFFTIIYIAFIMGALLAIALIRYWKSIAPGPRRVSRLRIQNILLSGSVTALVCLPRLWLSRDAIYGYYMVGHVLGEEKFIRAHELGLYTTASHLLYYPSSVFSHHVGTLSLVIAAGLTVWSLWTSPVTTRELWQRTRRFRAEFVALALAVVTPVMVLTANTSKSQVVGDIVVVPIILAMVLYGAAIWPRGAGRLRQRVLSRRLPAITMALALTVFVQRALTSPDLLPRADLDRIAEMGKTIANYAAENRLDRISLSVDRVLDYMNAGIPKLYSIENNRRRLEVEGLFGHGGYGIFATSREDALRLLAASDVIVLSDPVTDRKHPFPINVKIREYWTELWQWSEGNRTPIYSTVILGIPYHVFVRPIPKSGTTIP